MLACVLSPCIAKAKTQTASGTWGGADYVVYDDGSCTISGAFTETRPGNAPDVIKGCTTIDASGVDTSAVHVFDPMFAYCSKLESVSGLASWDVSHATSLNSMFYGCSSLKDVDGLASWNVSGVTDMSWMFQQCTSLSDISGLSGWDVSQVVDMYGMFDGCSFQTVEALSNWDVSHVVHMNFLFQNDSNLYDLSGLSKWQPSSVVDMSYAFRGDPLSNPAGIKGWRTPKLQIMRGSFQNCRDFYDTSVLAGWDVSQITSMDALFANDTAIEDLSGLSMWDVGHVTDMHDMFYQDTGLTSLSGIDGWNVAAVTDMHGMFYGCPQIQRLDALSNWRPSALVDAHDMFRNCELLSDLSGLSEWRTPCLEDMGSMFAMTNGTCLTSLHGLENWDVSHVTDMHAIFQHDFSLSDASALSRWDTHSVRDLGSAFQGTKFSLDALAAWDTSSVTDMSHAFENRGSDEHGLSGLANWDVSAAQDMSYMFADCAALSDLSATSGWKPGSVLTISHMFSQSHDDGYADIDALASWSLPACTDASSLFEGRTRLRSVDMSGISMPSLANASRMFYGCQDLGTLDMSSASMPSVTDAGDMFSPGPGNATSLSDVSLSSNISKAVIAALPTPPTVPYTTTGKWARSQYDPDGMTVDALAARWPGSLAGEWVWQHVRLDYSVTFDPNGGIGAARSRTFDLLAYNPLPAVPFRRVGFSPDGWNTKPDGTGTAYAASSAVHGGIHDESTDQPAVGGSVVTLYAQWKALPSSVTGSEFDIAMMAGEQVTIEELPTGASYEVSETPIPRDWTLVATDGTSGVISR